MNKRIVFDCIKICYKECPIDSFFLIVCSFLISTFPVFIIYIYNTLIYTLNINTESNNFLIIMLIISYCVVLFLKKTCYNFYNHFFLNYYTLLKFEKKMNKKFFNICLKMNYQDYLFPDIVNETKRAQNASINVFRVYQIIVEIFSSIFGLILIGGLVFNVHRSLLLFLLLTVIAPIADNAYKIIQKNFLLYKNTQKKKEEEAYEEFLTKSNYLKEVRVLNCFEFVYNKWSNITSEYMSVEKNTYFKTMIISIIFNLIRIAGNVGAYWCMTNLFILNKISLSEYSMAILAFSQVTNFFNQLFSLLGNLSEFAVMVKPFFVFIDRANKKQEKTILPPNNNIAILMDNISYKYPNSDSFALKNISLSIKKGSFVSIVGENGSGKTTLSKIILGFLIPLSGEIKNISNQNEFYKVSYIPQLYNCYCISLKDNILFERSVSRELLNKSLDHIGLSELSGEVDNVCGIEFGGIELSGGQKQKIAILRSMFKNAELLVFDEPTSSIDPIQESIIYNSLLNFSKGKTTIMISHRLALTKKSDLIIVLKDGEIVELGDHKTLIKKGGEYARLWLSQSKLYLH